MRACAAGTRAEAARASAKDSRAPRAAQRSPDGACRGEESRDAGDAAAAPARPSPRRRAGGVALRAWHYCPREGDVPLRGMRQSAAARVEVRWAVGGAATVGWELQQSDPRLRLGVLVAANHGRPGGACGHRGHLDKAKLHPFHRTQEEDIVAGWILAEAGGDPVAQDVLYRSTVDRRWGMCVVDSRSTRTIQGVDYVNTRDAASFADAWLVRRATLCAKSRGDRGELRFDEERHFQCTLAFAAGPNAGASASPRGSTARTLNSRSRADYDFFRQAVMVALRTALDGMIEDGVDAALVARLSTGIYAGPHFARINGEFEGIVRRLLLEPLPGDPRSTPRGFFFRHVIIPMLARSPGRSTGRGLKRLAERAGEARDTGRPSVANEAAPTAHPQTTGAQPRGKRRSAMGAPAPGR